MLCSKTIYNYIYKGLMRIRNHHLPEKVFRRPKLKRVRENKKLLGRSIEERPDIDDKLDSDIGKLTSLLVKRPITMKRC